VSLQFKILKNLESWIAISYEKIPGQVYSCFPEVENSPIWVSVARTKPLPMKASPKSDDIPSAV
jgi:hypothetical protein